MKLTITPSDKRLTAEYRESVEDRVCVDGSYLLGRSDGTFLLAYPSGDGRDIRDELTDKELSVFVRNFYSAGFTDAVSIR